MTSTKKSPDDNLTPCREHLDRFFAAYPNPTLHQQAAKALRLAAAGETPLGGKPETWAAGAIYAVANLERNACGVPGFLNSDFSEFFGVTMGSIRKRAADVMREISI
jgi:hypothetical protein